MAQELKDTLRLPKTDFPMRANLVAREPNRVAHWETQNLYRLIQQKRQWAEVFVLHDGPPFTNGDVHIGTALNKTLKDITVRYKTMKGFRAPFVPGWDCHGLPIEQKVTRELREAKKAATIPELRKLCDDFSESWILKQTTQFKRLGILADWDSQYKTKAPAYEADILRTFASFIEKGLVYRSKKPVYWSIPFETALAEAEIEYKDRVSPSIWVKFRVPADEAAKFTLPQDKPLSIVIWTTTPWTIPANVAIALHPDVDYVVADIGSERIIVADALSASVALAAKLATPPEKILITKGNALEDLRARHPFIDRESRVVLADYVTTDSGTGAVHTAPGHGMDDYITGLKYGLEIYCPVGDDGKYLDDGKLPSELVGVTTLESVEDLEKKRTSPANIAVLKKLAEAGALLAKQRYEHSYPHCWRSKTPIIFRAVDQWFVSLDKAGTRQKALEVIRGVQWIPGWGEARIRGAVEARPDWCISRQRTWGVPIPAFFDQAKNAYLDGEVARAIADKIESRGTNFWYEATPAEILEGISLPSHWPVPGELTCGRDTLDVWIDSGSSHAAVLRRHQGGTRWPADLYLEGSDQHRGWFQSSLWTGVVAFDSAPYRAVLTHGFIVDQERNKISKSSTYEKPQTSDAYIAKHGADVIRLWIASQDFRNDIPISDEILGHITEAYRQIRNTFRYQLSTLFDYVPSEAIPLEAMDTLDRWALHQTAVLVQECSAAYEAYEFHRVYQLCNQFCSVTLSATYHDILKDRLYTRAQMDTLRRSSQTAIHSIFQTLVKILAPIILFTTDEAWSFATSGAEYSTDSIHLQDWPTIPEKWLNPEVDTDMKALLKIRARINETIEPLRQNGTIGKSLDAVVTIKCSSQEGTRLLLEKYGDNLSELFIVSDCKREPAATPEAEMSVEVTPASTLGYAHCPRCWRWVPALESTSQGEVCPRCTNALNP